MNITSGEYFTYNSNLGKDIKSSFNLGTCDQCLIYKIGKIVFFQAKVTEKSSNLMTFASVNDVSLCPVIFTMLNTYSVSGLDINKKASAYISGNKLFLQTLDESSIAAAWDGDVRISGWWITD